MASSKDNKDGKQDAAPVRRSSQSVKIAKVPAKRNKAAASRSKSAPSARVHSHAKTAAGSHGGAHAGSHASTHTAEHAKPSKRANSTTSSRGKAAHRASSSASREPRVSRKAKEVAAAMASASENASTSLGRKILAHYKVILAVLVLVVFAFLSIYFPARDYYVAKRTNERLQSELELNVAHNEHLKAEVENLKTREGIEDHARKDLGMVMPGEKSINVVGITEQEEPDGTDFVRRIEKNSGTAESTWLTKFLDFFFGVGDTSKSPQS